MTFFLGYRRASDLKQRERAYRIASLHSTYHQALTASDVAVLSTPIAGVVENVRSGAWDPLDILRSYGKQALKAHETTNCLSEVMIADAEDWAHEANKTGPLAGVPVSLKDNVGVKGYDACIGYSSLVGKPFPKDSALVRLLKDAGAVPYVKTTAPITLLSFETHSAVFGVTKNPYVHTHSPGGSSGGEAALLALGGSRIGVGTDVAGSVRVPAHFSGIYSIKCSQGRFPRTGSGTSNPGQEGILAVFSPMARALEDLETFWKAVVSMKPWTYDHSCHPIPWRDVNLKSKKLTWGVLWDDGVVPPSPACKRALKIVVDTLRKDGQEVIEFHPPSPYEGLKIASHLMLSDGGDTMMTPFQLFEPNDPGVTLLRRIIRLPRLFRAIYTWYLRHIRRDTISAGLIDGLYRKTTAEHYALVAQREAYRARFHAAWDDAGIDFLLTVPNATPAVPRGGMRYSVASCGYSFLFNLLDYTAGVLPVTKVSAKIDGVSATFAARIRRLNAVARGAFRNYDAVAMHGLPVGVQVVGRRLEEEKVLEGMKLVESLLNANGQAFRQMDI